MDCAMFWMILCLYPSITWCLGSSIGVWGFWFLFKGFVVKMENDSIFIVNFYGIKKWFSGCRVGKFGNVCMMKWNIHFVCWIIKFRNRNNYVAKSWFFNLVFGEEYCKICFVLLLFLFTYFKLIFVFVQKKRLFGDEILKILYNLLIAQKHLFEDDSSKRHAGTIDLIFGIRGTSNMVSISFKLFYFIQDSASGFQISVDLLVSYGDLFCDYVI